MLVISHNVFDFGKHFLGKYFSNLWRRKHHLVDNHSSNKLSIFVYNRLTTFKIYIYCINRAPKKKHSHVLASYHSKHAAILQMLAQFSQMDRILGVWGFAQIGFLLLSPVVAQIFVQIYYRARDALLFNEFRYIFRMLASLTIYQLLLWGIIDKYTTTERRKKHFQTSPIYGAMMFNGRALTSCQFSLHLSSTGVRDGRRHFLFFFCWVILVTLLTWVYCPTAVVVWRFSDFCHIRTYKVNQERNQMKKKKY